MNVVAAQRLSRAMVMASGVGSLALTIVSNGDPLLSVMPVLAAAAMLVVLWTPPRLTAVALVFLALAVDSPQDKPMSGHWESPTYELGRWLFDNWSKHTGVGALAFTGMHALIVLLGVATWLRADEGTAPAASCAQASWKLFAITVVFLFAEGLALGGHMDEAYWQTRQLMLVPLIALVLSRAVRIDRDARLLGKAILAATAVKLTFGFYFHFAIDLPNGIGSPDITSHSDTTLFCVAAVLLGANWLEWPSKKNARRAVYAGLVLLLGIYLNNRRLAYVGLAGCALIVLFVARWSPQKRMLLKLAFMGSALLPLYLAAGWSSSAGWAAPANAVRTMVSAGNLRDRAASSTLSREVEDFNLASTMRKHPLGMGFGRPFEQTVRGADISRLFALFDYIPHNMLLGLLAFAGPLGFIGLWLPLLVTAFLGARSYRRSRTAQDRIVALTSICTVLMFAIHTFGDMGTQNWITPWLLGLAMAATAQRSVALGAWPVLETAEQPQGATTVKPAAEADVEPAAALE